jgi:hypothetical protein
MSLLDKEVINPAQTMSGIIWHSDERKDGETALELKFNNAFYEFVTSCCSWIYLLNNKKMIIIKSLSYHWLSNDSYRSISTIFAETNSAKDA